MVSSCLPDLMIIEQEAAMTFEEIQHGIGHHAPWFFPFDFGEGLITHSHLPAHVQPIFETRREMVHRAVKAHFGDRLAAIDCLDVGCHEGFYAVAMAAEVKHVIGVDYRSESIVKACFVAEALGVGNCTFRQGDVETLSAERDGVFPLTLLLGVLYHLENPMLALRQLASVTGELCVLETQVIDEVPGRAEWGSKDWSQPYHGVLAFIDETAQYEAGNRETGSRPLATCPSPLALVTMLRHAGFRHVEFVAAPPGAYEQHARGKRVVCAAYK
jgi:ubiquinone/menaquinone biosynthesis C-methylase UbiE